MTLVTGIQKLTTIQTVARAILRMVGWRIDRVPTRTTRYVIIGAPHTSNWDFFLMLLVMASECLPIRFLAKDNLFWFPLGSILKVLGGIPVNRRQRNNLVDQITKEFDSSSELIIGIAPEGTRSRSVHWKTGFYYIALKAKVPIVMASLDYSQKVVRIAAGFMPSGDLGTDFEIIRQYYAGIVGKNPKKQGIVSLAEQTTN